MDSQIEFSAQSYSKMVLHAMKYPHAVCNGLLLSPKDRDEDNKFRIIEAIPISHASNCLTANIEIAYNSVSMYCQSQELVICGFYQTNQPSEDDQPDAFSQKVAEKICESYTNAVLCYVGAEGSLDPHQCVDNKWRRRTNYKIETDREVIADHILYSKEKLYNKIVDFDEHFNNIALDWTNAKITQRIDHLVTNVC